MKKLLITTSSFDVINNKYIKELENNGFVVIKNPFSKQLSEEEVLQLIKKEQPSAIIAGVEPLTKNVLDNALNLKIISRCGAGIDNVDLDCTKSKGIIVKNTPDAPTRAVAEFAIGLIFDISKRISEMNNELKNNKTWKKLKGVNLIDKKLGIIGYGRIGKEVAKIASAIGLKVIIYDPLQKNSSLETLKSESDFITIHIPLTNDNYHFIDNKFLETLKNGVSIINTSRGGIIDEEALYEALKSKKISYAAIDVFEKEPNTESKLMELENIILTPHSASNTTETRIFMEEECAKNIVDEIKEL